MILNHIISFANVPDIDAYLREYAEAGFVASTKTVRHKPGLRNGFVYFGPEYIEFSWVENERLFRKGAKSYRRFFRNSPSPYGVAFESKNVKSLHARLLKRGYKMPRVYAKGPRDADKSVIWWTFQHIPFQYLPGAWTFALTYEFRRGKKGPRQIAIGKNTIYGFSGLTFVTENPEERSCTWRDFLAPRKPIERVGTESYAFSLGPHRFEWMTLRAYEEEYGVSPGSGGRHRRFREITLVHLLAEDLRKAKRILSRNLFKVRDEGCRLFIGPQKSDGFSFVVKEKKARIWQKERTRFGEKFSVQYL